MQNNYNHLVNEIIKNLDWDMVLGVHRMFKKGVGCEPMIIPGVKRISDPEVVTIKDLKNELRSIIKHTIAKGSGELNYGLWYISWYNSEDERFLDYPDDSEEYEDGEDENDMEDYQSWFPTKLQVVLAPQKMAIVDATPPSSVLNSSSIQTIPVALENMLEDAIKKEDYELANKLKAVISHQDKNKKTGDK
jgi:hypothetical protein